VDWGDLPDPAYPTLSANNGAAHALSGVAYLGKCVDAEANGQPDANATLDDTNATTPRLGACATGNDDEDGVTFGTLTVGQPATASVDMTAFQNGSNVCFLNAWIDFNGNGLLTDAGEQIASNVQMVGGAVRTVNFNIPVAVTEASTGARFRCSTQSGLTPTGQAPNGEVEDYMVTITGQNRDFGDAPDAGLGTGVGNYNTTVADGGPNHLITAGLNLGNTAPDKDNGTLQNVNADADDTTGTPDDEDGVTLPTITTTTTSLQMTVRATNTTGTAAKLACWIDFNRDGSFLGAGEKSAIVDIPASSGSANYTVNFSGFGAPVAGDSYIRCRIAYDVAEVANPTGPASSGEIEDFKVTITQLLDFGDLPDTTSQVGPADYQTVLANNGPRHAIVTGAQLGAAVDSEANGQPNTAATGDDNAGAPDDEDGVVFQTPLVPTFQGRIQVTASVAGCLNAWVDWNGNGQLGDVAGEQIATNLAVVSGANNITINPVPNTTGIVYSRFRFTQACGQGADTPLGAASSGEVEDYALASIGDYVWNDANQNGQQDGGEAPVSGVTVKLLDGSGNPVLDANNTPITDVTGGDGKYEFPGLPPGTYIVEFVPPAGNSFTQPDQGADATDSDASVTTGRTPTVTVTPGESNNTIDAGLVPIPDVAIGNLIWCDLNNNAIRDSGEPGQAGVTVRLYGLGGDNTPYTGDDVLLRELVTVSGGFYLFAGVPSGQYYVAVVSSTVPPSCGTASSTGATTDPDFGDHALPNGDDGGTGQKPNETVSGVITVALNGQTTDDTDDPLGYTDASSYMTVDFGFTTSPTSVDLRGLQAAPQTFGERLLDLLRSWLQR
jgi:hypothetical protein